MARLVALRRVHLPDERVLTVRPVDGRDVEGVGRLYARLDDESRYRRFFSLHRPEREFFERVTTAAERGGAGIVAVLTGRHGGRGRIVGEAGYELLANGDGELAITIDREWRGWLGPYLLDTLVDVAAAHAIPNLEAEVLLANGPMLALLRGRGYATMPTGDWSQLRVLISTEPHVAGDAVRPRPSWPHGDGRLRVLVEGSGGRWHAQDTATEAGVELLGCPGPTGGVACPAVLGRPCPLVTGADAVVVAHPPDLEEWDALRDAHHEVHPGVPVCVELRPGGEAAAGEVDLVAGADPGGHDPAVVRFVERLARTRRPVGGLR